MKTHFKSNLNSIHMYLDEFSILSDRELSLKTVEFKNRLNAGQTTDDIMDEAFAVCAEAAYRILKMMPYDEQIQGGIALHKCMLAEMATGEGKTLTATLPLYLNALTGKSTILVTANEYLANRDCEFVRPLFDFLGMTVNCSVKENPAETFTNEEKKKIYASDIVYTTHGTLGFDYLFENLVKSADERFLREFYYVIIDEADSVLLDASQMPLVISGSPKVRSNLYGMADFFVLLLREGIEYEKRDKSVWLTKKGVDFAEEYFGIENFFAGENFELNRQVTMALRAHILMNKEKDYIVSEKGEIVLLDKGTGRVLPGMKLRGGLHQAIEEKEKVEVTNEQRSIASITYQNLFLMFPRMSGMSGTLYDAKKELKNVYSKKVIRIPTHRKCKRKDEPDIYFRTAKEQFDTAIDMAEMRHETGQPVLIVTSTIQDTKIVSDMLIQKKIAHSVLNANNVFWEADIIKEAGQIGAVTVSTGICGRGTDIKLEDGAEDLGGLLVIGIGRMGNIRLERQARGRAGRQGDKGESQFFVSLEDDVVKFHGEKFLKTFLEKDIALNRYRLRKIIDGAQKLQAEQDEKQREQAVKYDMVLKKQRKVLYESRRRLLDKEALDIETIENIIKWNVNRFFKENKKLDKKILRRYILDNLSYKLEVNIEEWEELSRKELKKRLYAFSLELLKKKEEELKDRNSFAEFMRLCILNALDSAWVDEVDYLQQLQYATSTRSMLQRNPVYEYSEEAYKSFLDMERVMRKDIMRNIFLGIPERNTSGELYIVFP